MSSQDIAPLRHILKSLAAAIERIVRAQPVQGEDYELRGSYGDFARVGKPLFDSVTRLSSILRKCAKALLDSIPM